MATSHREQKNILLVEDRSDHSDLVAISLTGYRIVRARNFAEGLRIASERYFDLYILDNWLPDGTGVELCHLIRKFDPHTPIVFCSAAAFEQDIQRGMSAGAQAYLVKPFDYEELQVKVAQLTSVALNAVREARRAETAAIREELDVRRLERFEQCEKVRRRCEEARQRCEKARQRGEKVKDSFLTAKRKFLRFKAMEAFLAAGGTRGDFAREWLDEISNRRCSSTQPTEAKRLLEPFQIGRATIR